MVLGACSAAEILGFTSGVKGERTAQDVAYGENPRQTLDVYAPVNPSCRIVFVYGGSWREGDKNEYGFVGAQLAKKGFEVLIPNYRLFPEIQFPGFVEDIALSLQFIQASKKDELPLVLMGHSAGALIAALLSFEPKYLEAVGLSTEIVNGLVVVSGPHDYFLPTDNPKWTPIFGSDPEQQVRALPVKHVTPAAPKTLILHGLEDEIVTPKSALSLADQLQKNNVDYVMKRYEGVDHKKIIAAMGFPLHFLAPTLNHVTEFLNDRICDPVRTDK